MLETSKIYVFWNKDITSVLLPRACVQLTSQMEQSAALFDFSSLPALSEIKGRRGLETAGKMGRGGIGGGRRRRRWQGEE